MRERTDVFQADVGASQRSVAAVLGDLQRVERAVAEDADGRVKMVGGLEERVAMLETELRQTAKAREGAT